MISNVEIAEYGLTIPDNCIPEAYCKLCKTMFTRHPSKDWIYCKPCGYGLSRVKVASTEWFSSRTPQERMLLENYSHQFLKSVDNARILWDCLTPGLALDNYMNGTSKISRHVRLLDNSDNFDRLMELSKKEVSKITMPCLVMKLEDAIGRITGFVTLNHSRNSRLSVCREIQFTDLPKIGFYQEKQCVVIEDAATVIKAHVYAEAINQADKLPLAYMSPRNARMDHSVPSDYIYAPLRFNAEVLSRMAKLRLRTFVTNRTLNEGKSIEPQLASSITKKAIAECTSWSTEAARNLAKFDWQSAASIINRSELSGDDVELLMGELDEAFIDKVKPALLMSTKSYRLPDGRLVTNDGLCWKTIDQKVVLSANLTILRAERKGKVTTYFCKLKSKDWEIEFQCGSDFERRAFDVLLRESILADKYLTFDRSYSRYAVELARFLNPKNLG